MKKLALTLVLLAPLAASADDTKLPFNPYENAEKGDWAILTGTLRSKGWPTRCKHRIQRRRLGTFWGFRNCCTIFRPWSRAC